MTVLLAFVKTAPLPTGRIEGAVLVTIWLFFMCVLLFLFRRKKWTRWPQFNEVESSIFPLILYYIFVVIDRWFHYEQLRVLAGYVVVAPIFDIARIASTVLLLSGTFKVIWRAGSEHRHRAWWITSRVFTFLVVLTPSFYIIIYLALAACWLQVTSLNVLGDLASRRVQFEISVAALFMGHALLTLVASIMTCFRATVEHGYVTWDRIVATVAASLLFSRCLLEFVIAALIYGPSFTRFSLKFSHDVAYGVLSVLTYAALLHLASEVASHAHSGSEDKLAVESMVRKAVADRLEAATDGGRLKSPQLVEVIAAVEAAVAAREPDLQLSTGSRMSIDANARVAEKYLERLRVEEGNRQPKDEGGFASRTGTAISSLFGRGSRQASHSANSKTRLLESHSRSTLGSRQFTPSSMDGPRNPLFGQGGGVSYAPYPSSTTQAQFEPADSINPAGSIPMRNFS